MPLVQTRGAASAQGFGEFAQAAAAITYIEDVFSTYLYTGNAGTQTVTNGIDLSTKGGMVWTKSRSNAYAHSIMDTVRGFNYSGTQTRRLDPSTTGSEADEAGNATQATPLSNGFSITTSGGGAINFYNASGATYASWTFREQPKFFDIVTYTGNGAASRNIAHNLGSVPGCYIVKETNYSGTNWLVYHQSLGNTKEVYLNETNASTTTNSWASTTPTSAVFTVNFSGGTGPNGNGSQYVAYLFAHNAGGFGLTGTDNVISCGSFSGSVEVNLGYEAQWILFKDPAGGAWYMQDIMRGMSQTQGLGLVANTAAAESNFGPFIIPTATGFKNVGGGNYIYIAIRRGPMKVPTSGTSVFAPVAQFTTGGYPRPVVTNFPVDFAILGDRSSSWGYNLTAQDRLRGGASALFTSATSAENTGALSSFASNTQFGDGWVSGGTNAIYECFQRAPSVFDIVCYTGTGSATTFSHNLGVVPELMIVKQRGGTTDWTVGFYVSAIQGAEGYLNLTSSVPTLNWSSTEFNAAPTATNFSVSQYQRVNSSGGTYVAYLFATCAGVSKVGSYTGTGTTLQVNCGFTGGARFVLIKRKDSTGDWYVWDSARGIVSGNDPYLLLNSTAAEVTNTDYIDTYSAGFEISSTAPAAINASGGTFIFLAIA